MATITRPALRSVISIQPGANQLNPAQIVKANEATVSLTVVLTQILRVAPGGP